MVNVFYDEFWKSFGVSHSCDVCWMSMTVDQWFSSEEEAELAGQLEMALHSTLPHVMSLEGVL